jgi:hypothetical protein
VPPPPAAPVAPADAPATPVVVWPAAPVVWPAAPVALPPAPVAPVEPADPVWTGGLLVQAAAMMVASVNRTDLDFLTLGGLDVILESLPAPGEVQVRNRRAACIIAPAGSNS